MRRIRLWLIVVLAAAVVGGAIAFYFKFVDTAYSRAEFYTETGLVPISASPDTAGRFALEPRPGRVVLLLTRGEPHGVITTEHHWWETVVIDIPEPTGPTPIDLASPDVRVGLFSYKWRQFPKIGAGGVRGRIEIESVRAERIVADYDLAIDGDYRRFVPEHRHHDVVFRGRLTFRLRPRIEGEFAGDVWPAAIPKAPAR
jgi:hypothetical protein